MRHEITAGQTAYRRVRLVCLTYRNERSPGAVLGRSGSTGDLTDMEVSAVKNRTPYPPPLVA